MNTNGLSYTDEKGRTWLPFTCSFRNETDSKTFCFEIWAIDHAHAVDQLEWLKANAVVDGQIMERGTI